jgi:hypothetical protein
VDILNLDAIWLKQAADVKLGLVGTSRLERFRAHSHCDPARIGYAQALLGFNV